MLTQEQKAFFYLVKAGMYGETDPKMESVFPLSERGWEAVLLLARQQTVVGLVYRGLDVLPEEWLPSMRVMAVFMACADRIEKANAKMNKTIVKLWRHFQEKGITAVLQKGQGLALMYPEPSLRECGDIDIYFPDNEENPLEGIADANCEKRPDGSVFYTIDGIVVEQHNHLLDIASPLRQRFIKKLIADKGVEKVRVGGEEGVDVLVPAPEVNLLLISSHILKHVLGVGIGLRQICDYAIACRYYANRVDSAEMQSIYRKTGIAKWGDCLDRFLDSARNDNEVCHLDSVLNDKEDCHLDSARNDNEDCHLDRAKRVERSKNSNILLDIILKGGNFGGFTEGRKNAAKSRVSRKLHTLRSFCGNIRLAFRFAPGEWFWTMAQLIGGQFRW